MYSRQGTTDLQIRYLHLANSSEKRPIIHVVGCEGLKIQWVITTTSKYDYTSTCSWSLLIATAGAGITACSGPVS